MNTNTLIFYKGNYIMSIITAIFIEDSQFKDQFIVEVRRDIDYDKVYETIADILIPFYREKQKRILDRMKKIHDFFSVKPNNPRRDLFEICSTGSAFRLDARTVANILIRYNDDYQDLNLPYGLHLGELGQYPFRITSNKFHFDDKIYINSCTGKMTFQTTEYNDDYEESVFNNTVNLYNGKKITVKEQIN